jgi:hypothetical protein
VVPVECSAGEVVGKLDVAGHAMDASEVWLGRLGPAEKHFQRAEPEPVAGPPAYGWRFEGFPAGLHAARAWSLFDGKSSFLRLPAKDGSNGPVSVVKEQTTDLVNTFVTRPVSAKGDVIVNGSAAALGTLSLGPLSTYHPPPWESPYDDDPDAGNENENAFVEAKGAFRPALGVASGLEGLARARLEAGASAAGQAQLSYTLHLGGLSPKDGAEDGSSAQPTPWDVSRLHLRFAPPTGGTQALATDLADPALSLPALGPSSAPLALATQTACLADVELKLEIPPALGTLARAGARFVSAGPFYPVASSPLLGARGALSNWDDPVPPSPARTLPLALAGGFRYQIDPSVEVTLADASSPTWAYLPSLYLPPSGPLGCGDAVGTCLRLGCGSSYDAMTVQVLAADGVSPVAGCYVGGSAAFTVRVLDTGGLPPAVVSYAVDPPGLACGPSPTELCNGNCTVDPSFSVSVSGLAPGPHRLVACAGLASDPLCAHHAVPFEAIALACPPSFEVRLDPGEADVPAADPRVAPNLVATAGGCAASTAVTDDRPSRFPVGTTVVHFGAGVAGSCSTRVVVRASTLGLRHQAAALAAGRLERFALTGVPSTLSGSRPVTAGAYSYARRGPDSAIVASASGVGLVSFAGSASGPVAWTAAGLPTGPWRIAVHPAEPFVAVLGRTGTNEPWAVKVLQGATVLVSLPVPTAGVNLPQALTAIGWSPDGRRLAVAGVAGPASGGGPSFYVVHGWGPNVVGAPAEVATTVHTAPAGAAVHELLSRGDHLLLATNKALFRVDSGWHVVFARRNEDMAIAPSGEAVVLAAPEPAGVRLVHRSLIGAGATQGGPRVPYAKPGRNEVALTVDGRFGALSTYDNVAGQQPIVVYRLDSLSASSPPVALVVTTLDASDPQFER